MLGFLPGFPYMGDLPAELALPRRADPRVRVPAGSISIATTLTAIYPYESPGGWHLIGATPIRLFDPSAFAPGAPRARRRGHVRADRRGGLCVDQTSGRQRQLRCRERADRRMSAGLKVLAPGLHTTVQDLGRPGYQAIGVPVSGALDGFEPAARQRARRQSRRERRRSRSCSADRPSKSRPTRRAWRSPVPARASRSVPRSRGSSPPGKA